MGYLLGHIRRARPYSFHQSNTTSDLIMANRLYNVFFHTHTISGIIISAALYVIFFTGSISFLRDEINAWERNQPIETDYFKTIDFDKALSEIGKEKELYGRDINFSHRYFERRVGVSMGRSKDTTLQEPKQRGRRGNFFYMDMENFDQKDYNSNYSLGEFFYRLHFFAQLNFFGRSGYFLSGFVAFFFLFAVITGVIVHWKKIISSFYVFRPKAKWKAIWTDAHVALGMIGLPYQFMFAVTGAFLIIGYMVMLPPVQSVIFDDDAQKMEKAMAYDSEQEYEFSWNKMDQQISINDFVEETAKDWTDVQITNLQVINYGDENMHIKISGSPYYSEKLLGTGQKTYRARDGFVTYDKDPFSKISYAEGALDTLRRLHYGDFGGYGMKLIYLVLGLITCFVILSGVLIWQVARDRKAVSLAKRRFNAWLVHLYVAVCLSLYQVTALAFIAMKLFADDYGDMRRTFLYQVFFYSWLLLIVVFLIKRNNAFTNKASLWLGAVIGLFVPVANGYVTNNWLWTSWNNGYYQIFVVDLFWLLMSLTAFAVLYRINAITKQPDKVSTA